MKIKAEVSEDALIEAPARMAVKRSGSSGNSSETEETSDVKKPKYANGTTSPEPTTASTETGIKTDEADDEKEEKVTVSSTAANLYAALAADIIEDETDLEEPPPAVKEESKPVLKEEIAIKDESQVPGKLYRFLGYVTPENIVKYIINLLFIFLTLYYTIKFHVSY